MEARAMRNRSLTVLIAAVGLLFTSIPLSGHHATAVFDAGKRVTLTGSVVEWFWANPHCLLRFDVKDAAGQVAHWVGETQAPPNMIPGGWTRQSFKVGDEITITVEPAKSGRTVGRILTVLLPNGKTLSGTGGSTSAAIGAAPASTPEQNPAR
jgi:Family of unknown function (DUF6152)